MVLYLGGCPANADHPCESESTYCTDVAFSSFGLIWYGGYLSRSLPVSAPISILDLSIGLPGFKILIGGSGRSILHIESHVCLFPRTCTPFDSYRGRLCNIVSTTHYLAKPRNAHAAVIGPGEDAPLHRVLGGEPCPRLCRCICNRQDTRRNVSVNINSALRALTVYGLLQVNSQAHQSVQAYRRGVRVGFCNQSGEQTSSGQVVELCLFHSHPIYPDIASSNFRVLVAGLPQAGMGVPLR